MTISPLSGAAIVPVLSPGKSEAGPAAKPSAAEAAKTDPAATTTQPTPEEARRGDFAALIKATRPREADTTAPAKGQGGPLKQEAEAALTTFLAEANSLLDTIQADPKMPEAAGMVTAFIALLQGFDAATGGDATATLADNLVRMDPGELARLQASVTDPVAFLAELSVLAGLPVTGENGALLPGPVMAQKPWSMGDISADAAPVAPAERGEENRLPRMATPAPAEPAITARTLPSKGMRPADPGIDIRSVVLATIATARAANDADAIQVPIVPSELRTGVIAAPDMARPAEIWQPPASGFARNLGQQIRMAKVVDGHTRISLAPRGLGEIEIDMRPDEAGKLRIILRAENPAVLQALRGDRDGLLLTLSDSGTDVRDADLSFEHFGQRQRDKADGEDASPRRLRDIETPDAAEPARATRRVNMPGELDILT